MKGMVWGRGTRSAGRGQGSMKVTDMSTRVSFGVQEKMGVIHSTHSKRYAWAACPLLNPFDSWQHSIFQMCNPRVFGPDHDDLYFGCDKKMTL